VLRDEHMLEARVVAERERPADAPDERPPEAPSPKPEAN
jgi:hypothetical protein